MKYIMLTRSDTQGSYSSTVREVVGCIEGELEDAQSLPPGTTLDLTVVEMPETEYAKLPEFAGW